MDAHMEALQRQLDGVLRWHELQEISIDKRHNENQVRLTKIESELTHLDECLDRLNAKLFGNGQPGAIQVIGTRISELEKNWWRVIGFMAALATVLNVVLMLYRR